MISAIGNTTSFNYQNFNISNQDSFKKNQDDKGQTKSSTPKEFDEKDLQDIERLKKRDSEVKAHEQAHVSAGASNPQYQYEAGPDGKKYAVGGNADIELSEGSSPQETVKNAEQVKRAALAPANPSTQDLQIASEAEAMKLKAKTEESKKEDPQSKSFQNYNQFGKIDTSKINMEGKQGMIDISA